ncbi:MAG: sigma-70 family RNA polymerase sigma factor [Planctomycetota bacterium]|nr:sigma-70 family RNA polymerase sigma factor [Planctomycetota bacterium]
MDEIEALYQRYSDKIYNMLLRMLGDEEEALDVAQETFLRAHKGLSSFHGSSSPYTWLFRIALNCAYSHIKEKKRKLFSSLAPDSENSEETISDNIIDHTAPDAPSLLQQSETAAAVQQAILRLPEDLRFAVVLRDIEELSYEEIAEIENCPAGTVKSRVHRAREMLKRLLKEVLGLKK